MAEWSKAPVSGTGLRARVRIPLLSKNFFQILTVKKDRPAFTVFVSMAASFSALEVISEINQLRTSPCDYEEYVSAFLDQFVTDFIFRKRDGSLVRSKKGRQGLWDTCNGIMR